MSCADNLTTFKLDIENTLDNEKQVLAVFLDVSNAFNDVHSQILLEILANIGSSLKVLHFVKFLTNHHLIFSEININIPKHIYKGVPQEGVLSPLFYILYVYEIFNGLDPIIQNLQFADDVVLYIQTDDSEKSRLILENALVKVVDRLKFIGLDVSPAKTSFIHFNKEYILPGETEINISDITVCSIETVKFFGLYFDYHLSFKVFSIKQSIVLETIKKYVTNIIYDRKKKKNNVHNECILRIVSIEHLIDSDELPSLYCYSHSIMATPMCTNFDIGRKLQKSKNPNELCRQLFASSDTLKFYTDGSKNDAFLSVGSAYVCPELNLIHTRSIICKASIFTAECMAISDAMDIALDNNKRNINIFYPKNKVYCNRYIRDKFCRFINNGTNNANITIFWIPHVGITDNELADQYAKIATEQQPALKCNRILTLRQCLKNCLPRKPLRLLKIKDCTKVSIISKFTIANQPSHGS